MQKSHLSQFFRQNWTKVWICHWVDLGSSQFFVIFRRFWTVVDFIDFGAFLGVFRAILPRFRTLLYHPENSDYCATKPLNPSVEIPCRFKSDHEHQIGQSRTILFKFRINGFGFVFLLREMTFPLPKYMKIPVFLGFCSGKRAFFIILLLRYFIIKFKHLEENKMKTTENERKNAHYVIIQSVIIGEDELPNTLFL